MSFFECIINHQINFDCTLTHLIITRIQAKCLVMWETMPNPATIFFSLDVRLILTDIAD
jgi:hypothetical protein